MTTNSLPAASEDALDHSDIQAGILRPRPSPDVGCYLVMRIEEARDGRAMLGRLGDSITSAATRSGAGSGWLNVAITYQGLVALGVPQSSLVTFCPEFRQGMAARADVLGDVGPNAPAHWEWPLGTSDVHVVLALVAREPADLGVLLAGARDCYADLPGVRMIWRQDCYALSTGREAFGFRDGISHPAIEGSGIPGSNPREAPVRAGEFLLGHVDETGDVTPAPQPDALGRNGTYVVFRKLYQDVAAFRRYLRAHSVTAEDEELLAAKFVGRWRSGAPLVLAPVGDDPGLGADAARNNDFGYRADDEQGLRCPVGSHIRRMNPHERCGTPRGSTSGWPPMMS